MFKGVVLTNTRMNKKDFLLTVKAPGLEEATPGQFCQLKITPAHDPLLPRPLSIYAQDLEKETLSFLYRTYGRGTRILAKLLHGDIVELLGPLGKGFKIDEGHSACLVAGGVGIAPLTFLSKELQRRNINTEIIVGIKNKEESWGEDLFAEIDINPLYISEDGSLGKKGLVTDFLPELLKKGKTNVYSCGPTPMLKKVAQIAKENNSQCQVALEARMACGIGACLGCVCLTQIKNDEKRYKRVCVDGPVFCSQEVLF